MGAKTSSEMRMALYLVLNEGKTIAQAARLSGLAQSSISRVLKKLRDDEDKKIGNDHPGRDAGGGVPPRPSTSTKS